NVVMPNNNGKTNNVTYTLGAGTDAEVSVICDWRSTSMEPTASITPKYITIHNTGTYVSTANAKNTHNNTNKTSTSACWHYTVDNTVIYQGLADNRKGWHTGTSYSGAPANSNSIGIETCVNNFPQTIRYGQAGYDAFDNEDWNNGAAIMKWYEDQFDQTMKHTAYLALVLCERWGLNWRTAIKMHWDAMSYQSGAAGKDCPMQMRATYDPATGKFIEAGGYVNGRNGFFWQIFWSYLEDYAAGKKVVGDPNLTSASKLGTYQVAASDGLNVRVSADASSDKIGVLTKGTIVDVKELSGNWGRITMEDGKEGWCSIVNYGNYIGIDAQAYTSKAAFGDIQTSVNSRGQMTLKNLSSTDAAAYEFTLPLDIGTVTTPHFAIRTSGITGGYYFGLTQQGTGYYMMRDCNSGDQLVEEVSAPYMTGEEALSIDVSEWWKPADEYRINAVRVYLDAGSSLTLDYLYFAATSGVITGPEYNLLAFAVNENLMTPSTLNIVDKTKTGSYDYRNGMLTVETTETSGYSVAFDVNKQLDVNEYRRLLYSVESNVRYDIVIVATSSQGDKTFSLTADFWPGLCDGLDNGYIPAATQTAGLDFLSCYTFNNILPADGIITVKSVTVKLGGAGRLYLNGLQLANTDSLRTYKDGVYVSDSSPVDPGDVNDSGVADTTDSRMMVIFASGMLELTDEQLMKADVNGDGTVDSSDARALLMRLVQSV
ncbi:MAG: N-acetylmuramoyl-L-alanine amidase, partial [Clostridia bacterium]|nr:N-acetylmuramoyl-L-alanine amidase [Clostridia bacterium]